MVAKRFFYVSAGILSLALAYHFGATTATAQAPGNPVVGVTAITGALYAVTASGDTYWTNTGGTTWTLRGNVFGGSPPTPATQESWGQVKARYR